jgi:hypothetical protein
MIIKGDNYVTIHYIWNIFLAAQAHTHTKRKKYFDGIVITPGLT